MTATIGYATLQIIPSAKGALGNLQSEVGTPLDDASSKAGTTGSAKFGDKFKAGLSGAMKAAGLAIGVTAVTGFVKGAVGAASDVNESMTKVGVVFGESSAAVIDWSKNAASALGQSQGQALAAVGTFGNLLKGFGVGDTQTKDMSKSMVQLATDLASFNNTSVDEALQALQSGLTGETEPLKKFGVAINDAALKQEALKLGLIATDKEAMSPAVKAQASYALILASTGTAQGDFARTSDGLANQQKILSAKFEDTKAKLGAVLMPIFQKVTAFLSGNMVPVLIGLGAVLAIVFLAWIAGAISAAVATLAALSPIVLIVAGIALLVVGVIWAYKHFQVFRDIVAAVASFFTDTLWPILKGVFGWLVDNVPPIFQKVADFALMLWDVMKKVWDAIVLAVQTAIDFVRGIIEGFISIVTGIWSMFGDTITGTIQKAWDALMVIVNGIKDFFIAIFQLIKDLVTGKWGELWDDVKAVVTAVWEVIKGVVMGAWAIIEGYFTAAWTALKAAWQAVWDAVSGALSAAWDGIKATISAAIDAVIWYFTELPGKILGAIASLGGLLLDAGKAALGLMLDGIKAGWDFVWNFVTGLPGKILGAFSTLGSQLFTLIGDAIRGLWDGIKTAWNWIADKVTFDLPKIEVFGKTIFGGGKLSLLPHLAGGGIIDGPGASLAVVHSREMVLNAGQQAQLFKLANGAGAGSGSTYNFNAPLVGQAVIRSDNDITELSRQLARQLEREARATGTRSLVNS